MTINHDRIRERSAELKRQREVEDIERGYCELPFPSVSDVWAEQCYQRHWATIKPLLTDYAALVLANGDFIQLGKDDELHVIKRELEVAAEANDTVLSIKCVMLAHIYLPPLISGESKLSPEKYAEMVAKKAADYPYSVYYKEIYTGDYDGDYDAYYARKREELDKWQNAH